MTVQAILSGARHYGLRIATAESCTGGLVAAGLTQVAGASDVFDRGFITYSNAAKIAMLGVSAATLEKFGAVSEQTALEMAEGGCRSAGVDLCIAITGIAGPGGSDYKPEGRVCFALAHTGNATQVDTVEFGAIGRENVRQAACDHAFAMLLQKVRV
jgi:nicotinamide-nucleotide amidase